MEKKISNAIFEDQQKRNKLAEEATRYVEQQVVKIIKQIQKNPEKYRQTLVNQAIKLSTDPLALYPIQVKIGNIRTTYFQYFYFGQSFDIDKHKLKEILDPFQEQIQELIESQLTFNLRYYAYSLGRCFICRADLYLKYGTHGNPIKPRE